MNIDPPLPVAMELRVIVFDVTNVETIEEVKHKGVFFLHLI